MDIKLSLNETKSILKKAKGAYSHSSAERKQNWLIVVKGFLFFVAICILPYFMFDNPFFPLSDNPFAIPIFLMSLIILLSPIYLNSRKVVITEDTISFSSNIPPVNWKLDFDLISEVGLEKRKYKYILILYDQKKKPFLVGNIGSLFKQLKPLTSGCTGP